MSLPWQEMKTTYLEGEGRRMLGACLAVAFEYAEREAVEKIVMFTATGEGPLLAAKEFLPRYPSVLVVAVTPPVGRAYASPDQPGQLVGAGIIGERRQFLTDLGIPIVAAHLPFKEVYTGHDSERRSEWSRVAEALSIFGGGLPLAVQAVLMATDAGELEPRERVIAMTADTAITVRASRTETFLSPFEGLLIEHIICRPMRFDISKPKHTLFRPAQQQLELPRPGLSLPKKE